MSQAQSRTTVAGCSLEDLCRGVKNYVCDASCLVGLEGIDVIAAKDELLTQLTNIFEEIELQTDCKVKKFYIGKAIVKKRKSRGGPRSFVPFNPMDPLTWKKSGISSRWCAHRDKEYGKDGLVVLGAVTRDSVPKVCHGRVNQEQYAIALQQMILHQLMLREGDDRLENESFLVGGADGGKSVAYAIYVTFTLEEQNSSEHGDFLRYSPSSSEPSPPPTYDQYNHDNIVDLQTHADNDSIQSDDDSLPPFPPISFSPSKQLEVSKKDNLANAMEIDKMTSPLSSNNQTTNSLTPSKIEARMEEDILLGLYDHSVVSPTQLSYKQVKRNSDIGTNESTANKKSTFTIHDQNTLKSIASLVSTSQQAGCSGSVLPILQVSASETNKKQPNTFTSKTVSSTPSTDAQETSSHILQPVTVDLSSQNLPKSSESRQMSRKRSSSSMSKNANANPSLSTVSQKAGLPQVKSPATSKVTTSLPSFVPLQTCPSFTIPPKFKTIEGSQATYDQTTSKFSDAMERNLTQSTMLKSRDLPSVSSIAANSYTPPPKKVKTSQVKTQPQTVTTKPFHTSSVNKAQPTTFLSSIRTLSDSEKSKQMAKKSENTSDTTPSVSTVSQKKYVHVAGEKLPFSSTAQDVLMYATITKEMTNSVQTHPLTTHVDKSTISGVLQHKETIVHSSSTLKSYACSQHTARPGNFQDKLGSHHTTSTLSRSTNYSKTMTSTSQRSSGEPKLHALSSSVVRPNLIDTLATDNASSIISDKCGQNQKKTKKVTFHDPPIVSKKRNTSSALNRNVSREDNPKPQTASSKIFNDNVELNKDSTLLPRPISRMEQPNVLTATLTSVQDHLPHDPDISNNGKETVKATKNKERYRHKHEYAGPNSTSCTYVPVIQSQLKDYTKK